MSRDEKRWRKDDAGNDAGGMDAPPSDEELLRIWDELEPQTPSQAFSKRVAELVEDLRRQTPEHDNPEALLEAALANARTDFGALLTTLRERCELTHGAVHRQLRVDSRVLIDLEGNAVYPETLTEAFWRGYAALLRCRASSIAALIASYDRDKIGVSGMRAARSGPSMSAQRRASFLGEPDDEVRVQLDRRRAELVEALRRSP